MPGRVLQPGDGTSPNMTSSFPHVWYGVWRDMTLGTLVKLWGLDVQETTLGNMCPKGLSLSRTCRAGLHVSLAWVERSRRVLPELPELTMSRAVLVRRQTKQTGRCGDQNSQISARPSLPPLSPLGRLKVGSAHNANSLRRKAEYGPCLVALITKVFSWRGCLW